jgi:hypothetical protein
MDLGTYSRTLNIQLASIATAIMCQCWVQKARHFDGSGNVGAVSSESSVRIVLFLYFITHI